MVDGVLSEMELAALPECARQNGLASSAEAGVIVAGYRDDATQTAADQAIEEGAPVDFGLRRVGGDAKDAPPTIRIDADSRENGSVPNDATVTLLFVACVEEEWRNMPSGRLRQASSSSSSILAARLTWVEDRPSKPNSASTAPGAKSAGRAPGRLGRTAPQCPRSWAPQG